MSVGSRADPSQWQSAPPRINPLAGCQGVCVGRAFSTFHVTFHQARGYLPAGQHCSALANTKVYCLVNRGTRVRTTCPWLLPGRIPGRESNQQPHDHKSDTLPLTTKTHMHTNITINSNTERQRLWSLYQMDATCTQWKIRWEFC